MSQPVVIPEWVALLVGRLTLEAEAMRQALAEIQAEAARQDEPTDDPPPD